MVINVKDLHFKQRFYSKKSCMFRCNLKCVRDRKFEYRMEICCQNNLSTTTGLGFTSILTSTLDKSINL